MMVVAPKDKRQRSAQESRRAWKRVGTVTENRPEQWRRSVRPEPSCGDRRLRRLVHEKKKRILQLGVGWRGGTSRSITDEPNMDTVRPANRAGDLQIGAETFELVRWD